jgi:S1-C subfamily serine protease
VTNYHVIEGAVGATVRFADGSPVPARLVGVDPRNDLAVLRIQNDLGAPPLAIGVSGDLQVGQKVFAIGNPFGFDFTLTTGIVSALGRELPGGRRGLAIRGLIQTDAAINPGNSGGPLLDSAGRVIGVNTAIYSPTGGFAGIGFAVPIDTVNRVVPQLIETGRYAPPALGVEIDPGINQLAARQGLEGVLILGVTPGSPAEQAGLRPARMSRDGGIIAGDVIVGIDDAPVATVDDLLAELERRQVGEAVEVTILRGGSRVSVEIVLSAAG